MTKTTVGQVVAIICALISAAGPLVVHSLTPGEVGTTTLVLGAVGQVCACVLALFQTSPADMHWQAKLHDILKRESAKSATVVGGVLLALSLCGCAWLKSDAPTIEKDVIAVLPLACDVFEAVDPAQATIVCAIVDASGNILKQVVSIVEPKDQAVAFAKKFPSLSALKSKFDLNKATW